jgi:hypothetical protein
MSASINNFMGTSQLSFLSCGLIEWLAADNELPLVCPHPTLDADLDWIQRTVYPVSYGSPAGSEYTLAFSENGFSQAKRRLETGASILMVLAWESTQFSSANLTMDVRCLIKE